MGLLHVEFMKSEKFSLRGPDWSARLNCWSKVPKGHLLLDCEVKDENKETKIQMFCELDSNNSLNFSGEWQPAPEARLS